jgi:NAD(P)-dependent dehydrogenase (short-subunit alcohol dehydrogenase family)
VIVGVGSGLSAALARRFAREGVRLVLAARDIGKLEALCAETGAEAVSCDATDAMMVETLFRTIDTHLGALDLCVYNPSRRLRGSILELEAKDVARAMAVTAFGGFLVAQQAARRMVPRGRGCILFTGASASIKGFPLSAPFAMGKFALRGLAQSLARELHPKGVHVAHVIIDGVIRNPGRTEPPEPPDGMLDPDAIAEVYWQIATQDRSAWTDELALRPWLEPF